jgi:glycosyltransferase involved in cell wall biosynthesis
MEIALNAFFWGQEQVGSGQYLHHLVAHLSEDVSVACIMPPARARRNPLAKLLFEQMQVPRRAVAERAALLHVPYWAPPFFCKLPVVVTVHDLIPLLVADYRRSAAVRAYTAVVAAATRRADHIVADSEATKRDLISHLRLPTERITVVPLGVDCRYRAIQDQGAAGAVRERYGLPDRFLLYLGGFDPRKNVPLLLRSYQRVVRGRPGTPPLVIAGQLPSPSSGGPHSLRLLAREMALEKHIRFIGWVREEDKPALYGAADLFVFPSQYEGFGLPVLEAMACGAPVIATRTSSLPELVAEGGVLVPVGDEEALSAAIADLLGDDDRRRRLGRAAVTRAGEFTWERTAHRTVEVWRRVLDGRWGLA